MPIELEQYYALTGDGRVVLDGRYSIEELKAIIAEAAAEPSRIDFDPLLL